MWLSAITATLEVLFNISVKFVGMTSKSTTIQDTVLPVIRNVMNNEVGTIYLLHFDEPLSHAKHYLGWARIMEVLKERGIGFQLSRTWEGTRHDERKLKKGKNSPKLCPLCP